MAHDSNEALLDEAVSRLRAGELVVIPTETVYGLAADAADPSAVKKIFALKRRPEDRPLIVHLPGAAHLDEWAREIPAYARTLAAAFWPGPLTLILRRAPRVPDAVTGGQDTVGLRVPGHPLTLALLERFGGALAAPSANRYGRISPTTPAHVREQFGDETPLLLDGGVCAVGIESTIVSCLGPEPQVLRPGAVTAEAIERAIGSAVSATPGDSPVRTAGQDVSHYAPRTPAWLVPRSQLEAWRTAHSGRCAFLGFAPPPFPVELDLRLPMNSVEAARRLYAALHELDAARVEVIAIEEPPADWTAILDRLRRAAAHRDD